MNISMIHTRNGKPAISWPGVLLAVLMITAIYCAGVAVFSLLTGWWSLLPFWMLPFLVGTIVGSGVRQGLRPEHDHPSSPTDSSISQT
jgi:biotin transporter BioY